MKIIWSPTARTKTKEILEYVAEDNPDAALTLIDQFEAKVEKLKENPELGRVLPSITVKNIPEPIYKKLKQQAEAHHRSMNSEIIACLERSVEPKRVSPDEILRQARMMRRKVKGSLSSEEIQDAIDQGRP